MSEMSLKEDHSTNPEEGAIQIPSTENEALEEVARGIFRITLQDATSNSMGDGTLARGGDEQLMPPPSMKIPEFASSTLMPAPPTLGTAAHDNENDDFTILYSLDHELHTLLTPRGHRTESSDTMEGEELWLEEVRKKLETMGILGDECNEMLRVAMLEKVDQILAAIKSIGTTLASRTNEDSLLQDHASTNELHTRVTRALELVDSLDTQGAQNRVLDTMEGEELWLEEVRKKLETMGILGDECNEMLRVAMLEKVDQILAAIKSIGTTLAFKNERGLIAARSCFSNGGDRLVEGI
ncbi:hypothetical protein BU15DRAFT_69225 [Melanogaster broomeanus]|nr:hypothetical protein BU15DRAFT_69225 [Melanogaster broomeanus]